MKARTKVTYMQLVYDHFRQNRHRLPKPEAPIVKTKNGIVLLMKAKMKLAKRTKQSLAEDATKNKSHTRPPS